MASKFERAREIMIANPSTRACELVDALGCTRKTAYNYIYLLSKSGLRPKKHRRALPHYEEAREILSRESLDATALKMRLGISIAIAQSWLRRYETERRIRECLPATRGEIAKRLGMPRRMINYYCCLCKIKTVEEDDRQTVPDWLNSEVRLTGEYFLRYLKCWRARQLGRVIGKRYFVTKWGMSRKYAHKCLAIRRYLRRRPCSSMEEVAQYFDMPVSSVYSAISDLNAAVERVVKLWRNSTTWKRVANASRCLGVKGTQVDKFKLRSGLPLDKYEET